MTVGQPAPAFSLPGDDGKIHALSEHVGRPVVLYFYPKDDTPGCTKEACDFRDNLARVQGKGAVVYGVSRDSLASHEKFRTKYKLNFPLLSDQGMEAHRAYGTWGTKSLYGREFEGTIRSTFLIDRQGKVARVWPKVSVTGHVDEVLSAIEALA
ncbi:MAG: peroxiredoxin [Myxococcota bacterium]|nr:peroxiredoxin [Myxococcota bacterium]